MRSRSISSDSPPPAGTKDRKSTRLNSSHLVISYAVFCLKKKRPCPLSDLFQCLLILLLHALDFTRHACRGTLPNLLAVVLFVRALQHLAAADAGFHGSLFDNSIINMKKSSNGIASIARANAPIGGMVDVSPGINSRPPKRIVPSLALSMLFVHFLERLDVFYFRLLVGRRQDDHAP